jgi:hypothetical protein
MKGTSNGSATYCASTPASTGPSPRPPIFVAVATSVAQPRRSGGASSTTATEAVPVKTPADSPETTRPISRAGSDKRLPPMRKVTALAAESAKPASSMGRRPTRSDQLPTSTRAAITPVAYTAKITVTISSEKPILAW